VSSTDRTPGRRSFLEAAEEVLREHGSPLDPATIVDKAINQGVLQTSGATPSQTMKAKLSTDVLNKKSGSRFKRTGKNLFGLREWTSIPEFIADRFQKALLDEDIVVFDRRILRDYFPSDGITHLDPDLGQELIVNTFPMQRAEAEESFEVVQLVSQFLVVYDGRIAAHKRTRRLPESRLHGAYSILFGGHLNPDDIAPLFSPFDPINGPQYITRELSEEVRITGADPALELVGAIYDPRREVSKQHLGVLYTVRVPSNASIEIGERGFLQQLSFESTDQLGERIDEFENWSELVYRSLLQTKELKL
jgi:predicted NUDIX family phosphoesterase